MGLPAEKFENIEMYMPRRAFYAIEGGLEVNDPSDIGSVSVSDKNRIKSEGVVVSSIDTPDQYRSLHKYVNKIGERFWLSEVDDVSDPISHLSLMAAATKHLKPRDVDIAETDMDIQFLIKNSYTPPGDLISIAHAHAIDRVPDYTGRRDKKGRLKRLGTYTYHEVHDEPQVRFAALNALREDDFPAIEIVRSLEGWRWANDIDLSHEQHEIGRLAFETYLFSVGSVKFLPALGQAATAYLK